jgi:hypothetical protein
MKSVEQDPAWEADSSLTSKEIPRTLRMPKVHYRLHKSLSVVGPDPDEPQTTVWKPLTLHVLI